LLPVVPPVPNPKCAHIMHHACDILDVMDYEFDVAVVVEDR
jgi:hypothetical protein